MAGNSSEPLRVPSGHCSRIVPIATAQYLRGMLSTEHAGGCLQWSAQLHCSSCSNCKQCASDDLSIAKGQKGTSKAH